MRIISGEFKGKIIKAPASLPVRPTTDFGKTALFSMIASRFDFTDIKILDLYSGTGNLTYEFLSRGTNDITCIDISSDCIKFIRNTCDALKYPNDVKTIRTDALRFLESTSETFDIIVADPPYATTPAAELSKIIFDRKLLREDGIFFLEHPENISTKQLPGYSETRKYGKVHFTLFKP